MACLTVVGMLTLDTLWQPRTPFKPGQALVVIDELTEGLGGKGFVAAAAAAQCGLHVQLMAYTSPKVLTGAWDLKGIEVVPALCLQEDLSRTWTLLRDGEDILTVVHEAPAKTVSLDLNAEITTSMLAEADGVYLTTESPSVVGPILEILANQRPRLVAININAATMGDKRFTDRLIWQHFRIANLLVANESEERQILDRLHLGGWSDIVSGSKSPSLDHVVITLGAKGCRWSPRPFHHWYHSPAQTPEAVRCTLGAGDTFAGALVGQMLLIGDFRGALQHAQSVAALKVSTVSPSL